MRRRRPGTGTVEVASAHREHGRSISPGEAVAIDRITAAVGASA
ncbi:hypothetical protein [Virgisporangium ochraceum]|nr:hypothetical protein [Virgisporangium ochraceum]